MTTTTKATNKAAASKMNGSQSTSRSRRAVKRASKVPKIKATPRAEKVTGLVLSTVNPRVLPSYLSREKAKVYLTDLLGK